MSSEAGAAQQAPVAAQATIAEAVRETLRAEMSGNRKIVVLGEDVASVGGLFGATEGLAEEFGEDRVIDLPMAEGGAVGTAVGMAMYGLRPVLEIQMADFLWAGFDQLVSELSMLRYRSAGQYTAPLVVRVPYGAGVRGGPYQSQSLEGVLCRIPGLSVAAVATPRDAAGLLRAALRGEDPVVLLEPKRLYRTAGAAPEPEQITPIGEARRVREGTDVTLLTYGSCVPIAAEAAELAAAAGIQVELLDLRTLVPYDIGAVLASVAKTGRVVIVAEEPRTGSYAGELAAALAERALLHLEAPVVRVCGPDTPVPFAFEDTYLPDAQRVFAALERVANF